MASLGHWPPISCVASIEFDAYFRKHHEIGTLGTFPNGSDDTEEYLPNSARNDYFTEATTKRILRQLYPARPGPLPVHGSSVQTHYSRVFATLLHIGRAERITEFVSKPHFKDQHLPFLERPADFPDTPFDPYFDKFAEAQWKFCAPDLDYQRKVDWNAQQILPFRRFEKLGRGKSGVAYRIEIHPSHDQLRTDRRRGSESNTGLLSRSKSEEAIARTARSYVLKIFHSRKGSETDWDHEVESHVVLRSSLNDAGGVVRFHGCYTHGPTFNVLLEWAELGNLEQLMKRLEPPQTKEDALTFWKSYLGMLRTLENLRRMVYDDESAYQLCHFDIKPANVLVFPGPTDSKYDLKFKLGDFGSSVFCVLHDDKETYLQNYPGTRTYGAPECYNWDPFSETSLPSRQVLPHADLWSYGAIASELATWTMCGGFRSVLTYRNSRKTAHQLNRNFEDTDCFHDGIKLLESVKEQHQFLLYNRDPRDATAAVIDLIVHDMLQDVPEDRTDPRTLLLKADTVLSNVRNAIDAELNSRTASESQQREQIERIVDTRNPLPRAVSVPRRKPTPMTEDPNLVPSKQIHGRPSAGRAPRTAFDPISTERNHTKPNSNVFSSNPMFYNEQFAPGPSSPTRRAPVTRATADDQDFSTGTTPSKPRHCPSSSSRQKPMGPIQTKTRINNHHRQETHWMSSAVHHGQLRDGLGVAAITDPSENSLRLRFFNGGEGDRQISDTLPPRDMRERPKIYKPLITYGSPGPARSPGLVEEPTSWTDTVRSQDHPFLEEPDSLDTGMEPEWSRELGSQHSPRYSKEYTRSESSASNDQGPSVAGRSTPENNSSAKAVPYLSVDEAEAWIKFEENRFSLRRLGHRRPSKTRNLDCEKLSQLEDRDFVILIDDSPSMRPYWYQVERLANLLANYTSAYDDNGIDVRFLISKSKRNSSDANSIESLVHKNEPSLSGRGNMQWVLESILGKYADNVDAKHGKRRSVTAPFKKDVKKLILFVLTNGMWGDGLDVNQPIRKLVDIMNRCGRPSDQVGIQFLRFGKDLAGKQRLQDLDNFLDPKMNKDLPDKDVNKDIVDVEDYPEGNVLKMLLGSIDRDYDRVDEVTPSSSISNGHPATSPLLRTPPTRTVAPALPLASPSARRSRHPSCSGHQAWDDRC